VAKFWLRATARTFFLLLRLGLTTDLYKYSIQIPYLIFTSYHIM